jgi:hypothetical protein
MLDPTPESLAACYDRQIAACRRYWASDRMSDLEKLRDLAHWATMGANWPMNGCLFPIRFPLGAAL